MERNGVWVSSVLVVAAACKRVFSTNETSPTNFKSKATTCSQNDEWVALLDGYNDDVIEIIETKYQMII
jgi:hypothetical protein